MKRRNTFYSAPPLELKKRTSIHYGVVTSDNEFGELKEPVKRQVLSFRLKMLKVAACLNSVSPKRLYRRVAYNAV